MKKQPGKTSPPFLAVTENMGDCRHLPVVRLPITNQGVLTGKILGSHKVYAQSAPDLTLAGTDGHDEIQLWRPGTFSKDVPWVLTVNYSSSSQRALFCQGYSNASRLSSLKIDAGGGAGNGFFNGGKEKNRRPPDCCLSEKLFTRRCFPNLETAPFFVSESR